MNRAQRRNANTPKSNARKAGLTYLTVAGVVGGTIGLASPAHAAVYAPVNCNDLASDLTSLTASGGTLTANFTGNCDLAEGYIFQAPSTITGPTSGNLTLRFTDSAGLGFSAREEFSVSNLSFTRESNQNYFPYFIESFDPGNQPQPLTVSNSKFSDSEVNAAIYAEGNLTVSDSTFENLTSYSGGVAINTGMGYVREITNSTFTDNKSLGQGEGGTINSYGNLVVSNSTFDANESNFQGGAIYAMGPDSKVINNSTFVGNSANSGAAVFLSEGGIIANSTFWNNGDEDTYSIGANGGSIVFFGNILANDTPSVVKLIDPNEVAGDMGANLYTDSTFDDITSGTGSSELVTASDLKLSALSLNQIAPANTGVTKTVAIASDSVAYDFYAADSAGIDTTGGGEISDYTGGIFSSLLPTVDQRGASRPFGAGYDVGAFELGALPIEETEEETLANTGLPTGAGYLALVGLGASAILSGSVGLLRRRKRA